MSNFTHEQKKIIKYDFDKNLTVNACAGSGKTTVLLERAHIIENKNKGHKKTLILTTNNAVKREINKKKTSNNIVVETFHSFILNELVPFVNNEELKLLFNKQINSYDNWLVEFNKGNIYGTRYPQNKFEKKYGIDYLLQLGADIINQAHIKEYIKSKYAYVYVDECQDNNMYKDAIIELFLDLKLQIMLVGDVNQNLYTFAGGQVEFFDKYIKSEKFMNFELTHNFRCNCNIDKYANDVIKGQVNISEYAPDVIYICETDVSLIIKKHNEIRYLGRNNTNNDKASKKFNLKLKKTPVFSNGYDFELDIFLQEKFNEKNADIVLNMLNLSLTHKNRRVINIAFEENITQEFIKLILGEDGPSELITYVESLIKDPIIKDYYTNNAKSVSTIHISKGLEYKNVIIKLSEYDINKYDDRCLLYVACTRAIERLYVICN